MGNFRAGIAIPLLLSGCAVVPGLRISESSSPDPAAYRLVEITPAVVRDLRLKGVAPDGPAADALEALSPGAVTKEYVVGPGDVLSIVVWDHPELTNPTGEFRDPVSAGRLVLSDGTMYYPHIGAIKVAGQTVAQIREQVAESLSRVVRSPQVDVRVVAFRAQRVQVTGEVRQPGLVTLDDTGKGVLEAINERGGLSESASRRAALLVRDGVSYRVDLAALHSGSRPARNPALKQGDVVHVPTNTVDQVFVLGEVAKPAPVTIRGDTMTLTQALSEDGGLDRLSASDSGVLVFRRAAPGASVPTVFRLDLSRPEGLLLAGEFELQPRDVVYVKATAFAQYNIVINELLPTISALFQLDVLVRGR